jgi:hypothetical protein
MGKLIYMEDTIKMMGKKNKKKTETLIQSGEVVHTEDSPYLVKHDNPPKVRKTLDGRPLIELDAPMALIVNTKVPHKWILQDTETGEIYRGTTEHTIGKQWEKIIEINENK